MGRTLTIYFGVTAKCLLNHHIRNFWCLGLAYVPAISMSELATVGNSRGTYLCSPSLARAHANSEPRYQIKILRRCFHYDLAGSKDIGLTATIPTLLFPVLVDKIANRRNTSEQVTSIDKQINTIMIQVSLDILLSAMKSDKISARSRKTRQRSFSTCILGLISRYSRTAR